MTSETMAQPTIASDGEDPRFMGYYIAPDSTERLTVTQGLVWATKGNYAGECDDASALESCYIPTACFNSQISYDDGTTDTCEDGFDCAIMTIFQTSPFGAPSVTNFNCRAAWVAHTVYRQLATTQASSSSSSSSSSPTPTSTTTTPPPQDDDNGSGSTTSSSSNLGPALGGGLGGAAALLGLAALAVFLYRRKKKRAAAAQAQVPGKDPFFFGPGQGDAAAAAPHQSPLYPDTPYGAYSNADATMSPPSELEDGRFVHSPPTGLPAELPGSDLVVEAPSPEDMMTPRLGSIQTTAPRDSAIHEVSVFPPSPRPRV